MGKTKRPNPHNATRKQKQRNTLSNGVRSGKISKSSTSKNSQLGVNPTSKSGRKPHVQAQHSRPTIPFAPNDRILLVGEGDLSFACSLVKHHRCRHVTATVYENRDELESKYPAVGENITILTASEGAKLLFEVDVTRPNQGKTGLGGVGHGSVDRIFFNFPHVGGKSTDVNRQVRYNQELIVAFFRNAIPCLAPSTSQSTSSIIVTLFEGEPYTLWNIRDLARHAGLQVEKSFKFQAQVYPGYSHARTLGAVRRKNGEVGGGWKGEERSARSHVFVRKGEVECVSARQSGKQSERSSGDEVDEEDEEQSSDGHEHDSDDEDTEHGFNAFNKTKEP